MPRSLTGGLVIAVLFYASGVADAGMGPVVTSCLGTGVQLTFTPPDALIVPGCWFLGDPGQSCTQTCAAHGLAYDDVTRTVAGSDANSGDICFALGIVLDSPGTFSNDTCASPPQSGIGCIIDPGTPPGSVRCTQPTTTADAAALDSERICACLRPAPAPALSNAGLAVAGMALVGSGLWLLGRRGRRVA